MSSSNKKEPAAKDGPVEKKTCFVIMPISDVDGYPVGHFAEVYSELIEPAVAAAGYEASLATSTGAAHMIQLDVVTKVATADLCVCDLSTNNPNVLFEYGLRQAFDRPTVLLKDDRTRRIFDLSGFRDIEYDHTLRIANINSARDKLSRAIEDTVSGSTDRSQVFSLVRLMQLTAAATVPTSDMSKEDARFALLEKKIDGLSRLTEQGLRAPHIPTPPLERDDPRFEVQFGVNSISIIDRYSDTHYMFTDPDAFEQDPVAQELPRLMRRRIRMYLIDANTRLRLSGAISG